MKLRNRAGKNRQWSRLALILLFVGGMFFSGCATSRGVIDLNVATPDNPQGGEIVKINTITDSRVFELKPNKASIPSLKNGEIDDKTITKRAIGRKRNGYGKAMGDILLPEGKSVEALTKDALTRALREKGYQVASPGDPGYDNALPLDVDIDQFWAWFTPGFWTARLDFEAKLNIKGELDAFKDGREINSATHLKTQAAGTGAWTNILKKGINDLIVKIKESI